MSPAPIVITLPDGTRETLTVEEFRKRHDIRQCPKCGTHHGPVKRCDELASGLIVRPRRQWYRPVGNGVDAQFNERKKSKGRN